MSAQAQRGSEGARERGIVSAQGQRRRGGHRAPGGMAHCVPFRILLPEHSPHHRHLRSRGRTKSKHQARTCLRRAGASPAARETRAPSCHIPPTHHLALAESGGASGARYAIFLFFQCANTQHSPVPPQSPRCGSPKASEPVRSLLGEPGPLRSPGLPPGLGLTLRSMPLGSPTQPHLLACMHTCMSALSSSPLLPLRSQDRRALDRRRFSAQHRGAAV